MAKLGTLRTVFTGIALMLSAAPALVRAADPAPARKANAGVIDFEAEVIEGERRKPDIFVQMGTQPQTIEGVLFTRKDFNDFHKTDRRWRPSYIESSRLRPMKAQGGK